MSIEAVLAVASIATGAAAAVGTVIQLLDRRSEARVTKELKGESSRRPPIESDPRELNAYLFQHAGALSLREYATDPEAREVVERAIARVDDLLGQANEDQAAPGEKHPQLARAEAALGRNDVIGALAQVRLAVELELRDLAALHNVPETRAGVTALLRRLVQVDVIEPSQAQHLSYVIRVANKALHGEGVPPDQASEALRVARDAVDAIRTRVRRRKA